jgi:hypothetical protein
VDANPYIVEHARSRSRDFPEIRFERRDILEPAFDLTGVDIVTFNLCLHHFNDREISVLLGKCRTGGVRAVLINDLHRHWLAYLLFFLFCMVLRSPRLARVDGLLSIRKAFRREELIALARDVGAERFHLGWRWAFRYQLVLFLYNAVTVAAPTDVHLEQPALSIPHRRIPIGSKQ